MGREVRKVPANWQHPKDSNGEYISLSDDYAGSMKYHLEEVNDYFKGVKEIITNGFTKPHDEKIMTLEYWYEYHGEEMSVPDPNDYMPNGEWYQLFQTVSEGTPLTPPFEKKEELVDWLTNNKDFWGTQWSKEAAGNLINVGHAPSLIMTGGKLYKPEEQHKLKN